jgi:hypothetical protein
VIAQSKICASLVRAWHVDPDERFDFSKGRAHIEVKASESSERIHEFSVSQLRSAADTSTFVASVLLQKSAGGAGILDLATRIERELERSTELVPKLWANIAQCMGQDFSTHLDAKYDEQVAASSLKFVLAADVPCVPLPLPDDVLDVRLKVALSNVVRTNAVGRDEVERYFA